MRRGEAGAWRASPSFPIFFLMKLTRSLLGCGLALFLVGRIFAHDPGLSSANISRADQRLQVTLTFAWSDLSMVGPEGRDGASASDAPLPPDVFGREWTNAAAGFVKVFAEGELPPAGSPTFSRSATEAADVVIRFEWPQVTPGPLRVEFPVISDLPFGHRMLLTIGDETEPAAMLRARLAVWHLSTTTVSSVTLQSVAQTTATTAPEGVKWTSFLLLGIEHILMGFDHLCFLLALLLVAVGLRDVVALVTTFTVAHSLTLAAAATGYVSLSPSLVEPLIAASIVYIGIENLVLRRQPRHRLALVFGFGLIHGLGFATALGERLPEVTGLAVVPPLLAFNAGVELGQLVVAGCLVPLIRLARSQARVAPRLQPAVSFVIATAGFIWFFQRV